jgi:hypothetical protein
MHLRSLNSELLFIENQRCVSSSILLMSDVRQMPLCQAATMSIVNALSRDGEDALIGKEELLNGAVGGRMAAV